MERKHWVMVIALAIVIFWAVLHPVNAGAVTTQFFQAVHGIFFR